MKTRIILGVILALIFLMLPMTWIRLDTIVVANPIPVDLLLMPEEHIDVEIYSIGRAVWAEVNGTYPFWILLPPKNVTMYYPVPSDVEKVSAEMDNMTLNWTHSDWHYPTVVGTFPMINWTIEPVPTNFTVRTSYEHPLPLVEGKYTFLYAMGTGKYLRYYAKETTAYVTVSISKDVAHKEDDISVYTIGYAKTTGEWVWKPANYSISEVDRAWMITFTVVSDMFKPLVEDLLITIKTAVPVGGYSLAIKGHIIAESLTLYLIMVAILATACTIVRRKIPQKHHMTYSHASDVTIRKLPRNSMHMLI